MWIMKQNGYQAVNFSRFDSVGLKKATDGITIAVVRYESERRLVVELWSNSSVERAAEVLGGIYSSIGAGVPTYDMPPGKGVAHE